MVPLLPESAPFTLVQRAWLNGFFAGLLGVDGAPAATAPAAAVEETFPWHDPAISMDERLRLAEGRPLARLLMAAMAQLDCGACGYLCQTYSEAIASGQEKSLRLCAPGGKETAQKLKEILAPPAGPSTISVIATAPALSATPTNGTAAAPARTSCLTARLVRSVKLNGRGSAKDTRHVVIDLSGSGIDYEPGDSLGVFPENCPELVQSILKALGRIGTEEVSLHSGERLLLRDALLTRLDIRRPTGELLALFSKRDEDIPEGTEVIDLLEESPAVRPDPRERAACLSELRPRLYSIASSLKAHPDEVHLTVAVVRYELRGRKRKGVASTYLSERLEPGQGARVFVRPSHGFRLPASPAAPMIMIGPGTGIAPFRAFLEERRAVGAKGKNWLLFGDQRSDCDFLYREELEGFIREGSLTRLDTAFSRDQAEKVYVQHRLLERSREVWDWLESGAHVYICGDARRMAGDVENALRRIIEKEGGRGPTDARTYLEAMARGKRYQKDVY
ncbi:MAG TPA: sulfite reductase subunit alpha [Planctomycetota bacterium]|nr:sulfite reductase subunit alpha [Planctomycetota bacterium]